MARLQILELPEGSNDDRPPFVLIVDQMPTDEPSFEALRRDLGDGSVAEKIGARAVLAFEETVDIPANEITVDYDDVRSSIAAAVRKANGGEATDETDWHGILLGRRRQLTKTFGINPLNDWDGIFEAASHLQRGHDRMSNAIQRVRHLHRPIYHRGVTICWACSDYDFAGQSTANTPVAHDQCDTLRVLNSDPHHG